MQQLRQFNSPIFDGIKRTSFAKHNSSLDAGQPAGMNYYWKSEYITGIVEQAIETLVDYASNITSPYSRLAVFQITYWTLAKKGQVEHGKLPE